MLIAILHSVLVVITDYPSEDALGMKFWFPIIPWSVHCALDMTVAVFAMVCATGIVPGFTNFGLRGIFAVGMLFVFFGIVVDPNPKGRSNYARLAGNA